MTTPPTVYPKVNNVKTEQINLAKKCVAQCEGNVKLFKNHPGVAAWWKQQRDEWQEILEWWQARPEGD